MVKNIIMENILTIEMVHLDKYVPFVLIIQILFSPILLLVKKEFGCLLKSFFAFVILALCFLLQLLHL